MFIVNSYFPNGHSNARLTFDFSKWIPSPSTCSLYQMCDLGVLKISFHMVLTNPHNTFMGVPATMIHWRSWFYSLWDVRSRCFNLTILHFVCVVYFSSPSPFPFWPYGRCLRFLDQLVEETNKRPFFEPKKKLKFFLVSKFHNLI